MPKPTSDLLDRRRLPATKPQRWAFAALVLLALAGPTCLAAAAAERARALELSLLEGRTITAIRWQGLAGTPEDTAAFHLGLEPGQPFDPSAIDQALHRLWESGLFDDVRVEAEAAPEGVALVVTVTVRPRLAGAEIENASWELRQRFARILERRELTAAVGGPVDRELLQEIRDELEASLRAAGQRAARVHYRLAERSPGEAVALYSVATERRPKLREIRFVGNQALGDRRLRRAMRYNRAGPLAHLAGRGRLDREGLEADRQAIAALYGRRGFKDVVVLEPRVLPGTIVEIEIREGRRWKMGGVSVDGNRAFSDQRLLALYERPAEPWLDLASVEAWLESIRSLYGSRGRIRTGIQRTLKERDDGTVDVFTRVEEAEPLTVRRLEIAGNTRTRESTLRRELGVREGETLNTRRLRAGVARIEQRGIFAFDPDGVEIEDVGPGEIDLLLSGREARRFRTRFGGGWGEEDGASLHAAVETGNFLGLGHAAGASLTSGDARDEFEMFYEAPRLRGRPQSLAGQAFDRSVGYRVPAGQSFRREETGASLAWTRTLGRHDHLRVTYSYAARDDLQRRAEPSGATVSRTLERTHSSVRLAWRHDSRDQPLAPRTGIRAGASIETAGGALGGEDRFHRAEASFQLFRPLIPAVGAGFALRLAGGWIEPAGGVELSPLETWFLGGALGPRGFASRSLAARGEDDQLLRDELGFLVGGTRYAAAGLELQLDLVGPLRLALFADAANAYADNSSFDLARLRPTAGVELRLTLPGIGLPLRLIYSENLDPLPGDRFDSFQVRFGGSW